VNQSCNSASLAWYGRLPTNNFFKEAPLAHFNRGVRIGHTIILAGGSGSGFGWCAEGKSGGASRRVFAARYTGQLKPWQAGGLPYGRIGKPRDGSLGACQRATSTLAPNPKGFVMSGARYCLAASFFSSLGFSGIWKIASSMAVFTSIFSKVRSIMGLPLTF